MKIYLKSLILSLGIFIFHFFCLYIVLLRRGSDYLILTEPGKSGSFSFVGMMIYSFIIAFWVYYLLSFVYVMITRSMSNHYSKLGIGLILMICGYLLYRTGDLIDGDFISRFQFSSLLIFLLSAPLLILMETLLSKKAPNRVER